MARFVARHARHSVGVRSEIVEQFARGTRVIEKGLEAQFEPRGMSAYEKETAAKLLRFHGLPEDKETGTDVSPRSKMGLFDSEAAAKTFRWTQEDHDLVVETLRNDMGFGIDYVEIETPKRPAPWAAYDKLEDEDRIVETALEIEAPLADVLAYERENLNRPGLVKTLEDLLAGETEPAVVIEA